MRPSFTDRLATLALILVPLIFGAFAVSLGQDSNWDLRNYHWYNPYAFLHGRLAIDLAPAQIASFYNPLLDAPIYLLGSHIPARAMAFVLGTIHGLNFVLLFVLATQLLAEAGDVVPVAGRRGAAAIVALVGVLGGGHLSMVGTTFNDNIVSLGIFAAAALILSQRAALFAAVATLPGRREALALLGAGVLIGLAVGFKLPTAPFAVGFCLAFLCVGGGHARRFAQAFLFGLGVLAGFAVAGAPWMVMLWRDYANPLFPYFNGLFHSPMGLADSYRDTRFIPDGLGVALGFPYIFSAIPQSAGEIDFYDYRIATAYTVLIVTAAVALVRRLTAPRAIMGLPSSARFLIAAAALSYIPWLLIFSVYRYIVPLEMLAPLLTVAAIAGWPLAVRFRRSIIVALLVLVTLTARRGDWGHMPWQPGPFVTATAPPVAAPSETLALLAGNNPVSWVIPFFPPQIPFLRIQGYLNSPGQAKNGLNDRAQSLIAAHRGDIFALFPVYEQAGLTAALTAYGLAVDETTCRPVPSNLGDYVRWCRVYRMSPPAPPPL